MAQSRTCRHNANPEECDCCRWYHRHPDFRPFDLSVMQHTPWGPVETLQDRPDSIRAARRGSRALHGSFRSPSYNNNPQFDDELRYESSPSSSSSHSSAFTTSPARLTTFPAFTELRNSPFSLPSYSEATTTSSTTEHRTQMLHTQARSLAERSDNLMLRGREFCDSARITPMPRAFAYPSSDIIRRDHETRLEARQSLEHRWRDHLYDVAVWREALSQWDSEVARTLTTGLYDHDLVLTRERLQRDERELGALIRQAGLEVPSHLTPW